MFLNLEIGDENSISPVHWHMIKHLDDLLNGDLIVKRRDSVQDDRIVFGIKQNLNQESRKKISKTLFEYENKLSGTCCLCGNNHSANYQNIGLGSYPFSPRFGYPLGTRSEYPEDHILCNNCAENLIGKEQQGLVLNTFLHFQPITNSIFNNVSLSELFLESWIWYIGRFCKGLGTWNEVYTFLKQQAIKKKRIRFINPLQEFDFAEFGQYFFYDKQLYVISDKEAYRKFDEKDKFKETSYEPFVGINNYVVKAFYSGQYTGIEDINDQKIYTGDVIKFNGTLSGAGVRPDFENIEITGPISLSLYSLNYNPFHFLKPAFILDSFDGVMKEGRVELLGNIFHKIKEGQSIDINFSSYIWHFKDTFFNELKEKAHKNELLEIRTPNFNENE